MSWSSKAIGSVLAGTALLVVAWRLVTAEELPEPKEPAPVVQADLEVDDAAETESVQQTAAQDELQFPAEPEPPIEPAAHAEADHAEGPNPLAFDPDLAIFTFIVFVLLLMILGKFAWPTITAALDARERSITDNIAAAEAKHEDAKKLLAAHEARLAAAADEVRELLEEARRDAEHTKSQIVAEARKAADEELQRGKREIQQATDSALKELAESSANSAIELASKIVREKLNPNEQTAIIRDALSKLASSSPSKN